MTKVVSIGGGSGQSVTLSALGLVPQPLSIAAVVTAFDNGGSSGLLSTEFGYPPFGDLRQCMVSLSEKSQRTRLLAEILDYRFPLTSSLRGHSLGNLLLASLTERSDDGVSGAIATISKMLRVKGKVLLVTDAHAELEAILDDGSVLSGETSIDYHRTERLIKEVRLSREVPAAPSVVRAIKAADLILLGPGDLYTSVIPNLLPAGITDALAASRAKLGYICNIMTKYGETTDYKASEFAGALLQYLGRDKLDYIFLNDQTVPAEILAKYAKEHAQPVELDLPALRQHTKEVVQGDIMQVKQGVVRHSPEKLAAHLERHLL